jgi:hypothetical protein
MGFWRNRYPDKTMFSGASGTTGYTNPDPNNTTIYTSRQIVKEFKHEI